MTDNRYQPPQSTIQDELAIATEGGTGSFDVAVCLSDGWRDTWASFPTWLGVGVVWMLLLLLSAITVIGVPFVWPGLFWGGILFCLHVRDRRENFSDLFSGFSNYWPTLGRMLLWYLLWILVSIPGSVAQMMVQGDLSSGVRIALGYGVGFAWGLLVTIRFFFSMFFVVERDLGAVEAMQASWRVTAQLQLRLVLLLLASYAVMVAGFLALGVGVIPAMMMFYMMWVSAYRQTVGSANPA